ncbi:MAG: ATP synthase F0 subunit B [Deltaproteobacteria bacterium]|nr:ATP synthase F0 subunit B [Deltaproteobacteria bacterium]
MYFDRLRNFTLYFSIFVIGIATNAYASDDLLSVNYTVFIQIAIFLLAIFILNKLVFKPFLNLVDRRDKLTRGAIEEAQALEVRVEEIIEEYDVKLNEARALAVEERNKIILEGQTVADSIIGKAREETEVILEDAKIKLEADTQEIKEKIKGDIDELAEDIASRVLGKEARI